MNLVLSCVGALLTLAAGPCAEQAWGQRAPCRNCDSFRDPPIPQIRSHCIYPCECDDTEVVCSEGVTAVRDGCGCCHVCPRQLGQQCDKTSVCHEHVGLYCHYPYVGADVGLCQGRTGLPCTVGNSSYRHGETFHADCRTQCTCQNGTYACSSLCPNENISPRAACDHPRLVDVPGQCCREWMCDSTEAEHPPICKEDSSSWSSCSASCGLGTSYRMSNSNGCVLRNETRLCQLRPCHGDMLDTPERHHHIRKGHDCKATRRVAGPVRLRFGTCHSRKRYRPRFCGHCTHPTVRSSCCTPQLSTTIQVEFVCDSPSERFVLEDVLERGRDLWWPDDLMAVKIATSTQSYVRSGDQWEVEENSIHSDTDYPRPRDKWSAAEQSGDVYHLDKHFNQNLTSSEGSFPDILTPTTTLSTTSKPKRRRKKPRKPYTSWLEFRDEEYQMDEYEDYDETDKRSKRSVGSEEKRRDRRDLEKLRQYSRKVGMNKSLKNSTLPGKSPIQSLSEISKLPVSKIKSVSDFHMYKTIKSHIKKPKPPVKPASMMQSRRKWREKEKARKKEERQKLQVNQRKGKNNKLSKMERIIRGKGNNVTRSWWTDKVGESKIQKRELKRQNREKRALMETNLPYHRRARRDTPHRLNVQLSVEWIVKCGCEKKCSDRRHTQHDVTTITSELSDGEDGEVVLRRVHRTAPP